MKKVNVKSNEVWANKMLPLLISMTISGVSFADTAENLFLPNTIIENGCVASNTGVYENSFNMIPVYEDIIYNCTRGYYLPANSENCTICPENHYCTGGEYTYNATSAQGVDDCPSGSFAPTGAWECGRIMHVGTDHMYLVGTKYTTPSLAVKIGQNVYYANMSPISSGEKPMNKDTDRILKLLMGNVEYCVYDNTVLDNTPVEE